MIDLFNFRQTLPRRGCVHVCVIDQASAEKVISIEEINSRFLGHILYGDENGKRYVGVWGKRASAKLRSILRARGAALAIQTGHPPGRLIGFETQGLARARAAAVF